MMSDTGAIPIITARIGDRQRRLSTPKQWRLAIHNGDLTRESPIQYELGLRQEEMLAGDCPELTALFDELLGPVQSVPTISPPPPPPPPAPPPTPSSEISTEPDDEADDEEEFEQEQVASDQDEDQPEQAYNPVTPSVSEGFWTPKTIGIAVIAVFAILVWASRSTSNSGPPADPSTEQAASAAPAEEQGSRFYTRRTMQISASPHDGAPSAGKLGRGQEVFGVYDSTAGWVRLTGGSSGYVPASALQDSAPPPLDGTAADDYFALEPAPILSAPTYGSTELGTLAAGAKVSVFGTVNNEFAEYAMDDGSIGYVRWDVFGGVGGKGRRAWLEVSNRCDTYKNLSFSLVVDGERINYSTYWSFPPGMTDSINFENGPRIEVDSAELYYRDLGEGFHLEPFVTVVGVGVDQVRVNGELKEMKRLVPVATDEGAYRVTFC
jgi:hypothetical protein